MYKKKIVFVLMMLNACPVFSQKKNAVKTDTLRNIELPAAVVREVGPGSNSFSESATRKIDRKTIQRLNQAQDLPYLLNSVSSVVASSDAGTGTGYTGIRIRGADLTRINVTMNGVPVNDVESQATYFVNTPDILSSAQQVEVSKGVGNSKNGVGNFGAGISINNLDVNDLHPVFKYQTDFGSFNTLRQTLKASTGLINEHFTGTVRLSSIKSNGYIARSAADLKALQMTAKYQFDANTQLVFNYLRGREKTGQAWNGVAEDSLLTNRTYNELGMKSDGTFYNNQTDNYGQDYYQLFFDRKLNQHWALGSTLFYTKGKGYYEEYKTAQYYSDYGLSDYTPTPDTTIASTDLVRQLWLDNDFYGGRIYATYLSRKLDAGLYLNYNQYDGRHFGEVIWAQQGIDQNYRWYNLSAAKSDANLYTMLDYKATDHVSLFADLQYRNVQYTLNGFRKNPLIFHDLHYNFFNPKMKLTFKNYHHLLSVLAGIAQKEPNRDDIEAGAASLPKPEKLLNTELTYVYRPNAQLSFHTNVFGMFYKDQLVLTGKINDVGAYTRTNIDRSYRIGVEFEWMYRTRNRLFEMNVNLALSQNKILNFTEYVDDYDNGGQVQYWYAETDIAFSPSVIAGGRFSVFPLRSSEHAIQDLSVDILPKYVGKQYLDNTTNAGRAIGAYFVSDVLLNCPFKLSEHTILNLRSGVYNMFNSLYEANGYTFSYIYGAQQTTQNYYYPQSGLRWMLGAGIEF
jgi:iron complex outermembrane receptor protein